jgi:sensor histidine kinase regulating citrate/malate metabolism
LYVAHPFCYFLTFRYLKSEANGEKIQMPQIRVVVVKGKEDVTIKVADRGGGIPRSKITNILKFAQSTAEEEGNNSDYGRDEVTGTKIRGFGLPLARIYARYLGGELTLKSMEGYGLDAYLQLPRLGDSCENLPLPVKFSPGELNSNPPRRAAGVL